MWNRLSHHIVWLVYSVTLFGILLAVWLGTDGPPLNRWGIMGRRMEIWLMAVGSVSGEWLAWEATACAFPRLFQRARHEQAADYDNRPDAD